jgi:hypothetical protein
MARAYQIAVEYNRIFVWFFSRIKYCNTFPFLTHRVALSSGLVGSRGQLGEVIEQHPVDEEVASAHFL